MLCLSEQWCLVDRIEDVKLNDFYFYLIDHFIRCSQMHGGLAILVGSRKARLSSSINATKDISVDIHFECAVSKIQSPGIRLLVTAVNTRYKGNLITLTIGNETDKDARLRAEHFNEIADNLLSSSNPTTRVT